MARKGKTNPGAGQPGVSTKPTMVTQSARFTAEQMAVLQEAAATRGWSLSRLIQAAAVEKAAAICNMSRTPTLVRQAADTLARLLIGGGTAVTLYGKPVRPPPLGDSERLSMEGWQFEDTRWVQEDDVDVEEGGFREFKPEDGMMQFFGDESGPPWLTVYTGSRSNEENEELIEMIRQSGAVEFAALLREVHEALWLERQGKSAPKRAPVDPQKLL